MRALCVALLFAFWLGESDFLFGGDDWRVKVDLGAMLTRLTQLADIRRVECSSAQVVQDGNVLRRGECRNVLSLYS
jgi:hypothetical protein